MSETADPYPNAADDVAQEKLLRKQRREAREVQRFWTSVLATKTGRAEIWRLLDEAGTFRTEFACGPTGFPDPNATFFKLGQSTWGMRLYQDLLVWDRQGVMRVHDEHDHRFVKQPRRRTIQDESE